MSTRNQFPGNSWRAARLQIREEADQGLLEHLAFQERCFSVFPIPMFIKDRRSVYVFVNEAFADFLALPPDQVLGRGPFDLFSPEFASKIIEQDQAVMTSGRSSVDFEAPFRTGRGELVWLKSYKSPVFNDRDEVIGLMGGDMDITASKRAEEERKRNEERWKFAVDGAGDGVCDWNIETGEVFYSSQWKALLGYRDDEIEPSFAELESRIHPEDLQEMNRRLEEHLHGLSPSFSHEFRLRTKSGAWIWVLNRAKIFEWKDDGSPFKMIGVFTDITRRKSAEEMILHQATHDMLTGLPNRLLFNERLYAAICDAIRLGGMSALFFMDLDNFKAINDTMGHSMGDLVLMAVAERLSGETRAADTLARLGGDEFAIVMPLIAGRDDAAAAANRMLDALRREIVIDGRSISISGSMGIALCPDDGEDLDTLMKKADIAMYRVKREGRNAWGFSE
ncbi:MAG: diguanylate cyclase [Synergistota bacterium]|nr:diguanylate cyclase [Synergistota bacterium]OPZ40680.1 MAG: putative diguanylate cyclase YegE [Synergistetes bacterium ADurb.BinA166]